jgi:peptide/nickel transport system substrate-binding protein
VGLVTGSRNPAPARGTTNRQGAQQTGKGHYKKTTEDQSVKRWASMLAVSAVVAAACASSSATPQYVGPKYGGTLTVALDADMAYADPSLVSDAASIYVANQVVEGLVGLAPGSTDTIVPVLAAALPTVSPDGRTYTFKLRSGIKFHDGTDFDAAAVKANYDRWNSFPKGDLQTAAVYFRTVFGGFGQASNLAGVDDPDPTTVVFHLRQAQGNFLASQTVSAFGIQSPAAITANDGNNPSLANNAYAQGTGGKGKAMVGTGPFMLSEWKRGDRITLVKNPNYWNQTSGPYLDQLVFKPSATPASELLEMQSGAVDLVASLAPSAIATVAKDTNLVVLDRGAGCNLTQLGLLNADTTAAGGANVMANKGARMAVATAVNKPAYINGFYGGAALVADSWLPNGAQYYKREYLPTFNVTAARGDLAGGGLPTSGVAVDLWYPTSAPGDLFPDAKGLATSIATDLGTAGFKVTLRSEAYSPNYLADEASGNLQMWLQSRSCRWASPDDFLYSFFGYVNNAPTDMFGYKNDDLNTLMTSALQDVDPAQAKAQWQKAQDLIAADMPTVPLLSSKLPAAAHKYVKGFVGAGNQVEILTSVWLDK